MSKQNRSWFFTVTKTLLKKGTRFLKGDFPSETTFRNLTDSVPFFDETSDRAKTDAQGLVYKATDAEAKSYDETDTGTKTKAVVPSQLPEVKNALSSDYYDNITSINDVPQFNNASLEVITATNALSYPNQNKRNIFVTRLSSGFKTWIMDNILPRLVKKGGTTGQVLAKASNTDYDLEWSNPVAGPPGPQGPAGVNGTNGTNGTNAYTYIAYADANDGTGFTTTFNVSKDWIAIRSTTSPLVPVVGDFAGLWKRYGASSLEDVNGVVLKTKVIEIGDWDMDADSSVNVPHGLADISKIRGVSVIIRCDAGTFQFENSEERKIWTLNSWSFGGNNMKAWITGIGDTSIGLQRDELGNFDSTAFNATTYNRGWVTITYVA